MSNGKDLDLIVIGGGPAGYVAAIRAAQLGQSVACVERDRLGGVCLNWGCIPTKALLAGAEFYHRLQHEAGDWGILADNVRHDWDKVIGRSRGVADNLNKGIGGLFRKHKIKHLKGSAKIIAAAKSGKLCEVEITGEDGKSAETLKAKNVLIATGAQPRGLPFAEFDGDKVITSKEAMTLKDQPKKLLVIGAGAIGMEFAYFYNAFGTEVTVVEMLDRLLPQEDHEVSAVVAKQFKKYGVDCRTSTAVLDLKVTDAGVEATIAPATGASADKAKTSQQWSAEKGAEAAGKAKESESETIKADKVLVAIGVKGRYDGLFDDSLGLELFKDHIKVDKKTYATNLPGIYAVGDVIGPPWLAHVASEEAVACVEQLAGEHTHGVDYSSVPGCTYCQPQVASLGLTEQACKDEGLDYKVGKFPFIASGKAQALGNTDGFVKIIRDTKYGEILGVHMVGENVTELIAEMGLARTLEATYEEVIATMHAHPTLSEAVHEAALGTDGRMVHF